MKCCGGKGPSDYVVGAIPSSCCKERNTTETPCLLYNNGCVKKLLDFLQDSVQVVGYVVIGTAVVEVNAIKTVLKLDFFTSAVSVLRLSAQSSHCAYPVPSGMSRGGGTTRESGFLS